LRLAPPRRGHVPAVRRPRRARRPPPPPRPPGRRLPLQGVPTCFQHVHRNTLARDAPQPGPDPLDPPRHRPRGARRETRPRGGDQPPTRVATAARDPGPRAGRRRPLAATGRPGRGRRVVPKRGGKKGSRTPTPTTRRGGERTRPRATAPGR